MEHSNSNGDSGGDSVFAEWGPDGSAFSGTRLGAESAGQAGRGEIGVSGARLGAGGDGALSLSGRLRSILDAWAQTHFELVVTAAEFADGREWFLDGAPTPAAWLAFAADVEQCTAREWIRIGRCLQALPLIADAFKRNAVSYTKVRALTRLATAENEAELLAIAETTAASDLGKALAAWMNRNAAPEDIDRLQYQSRSVKWRTEPDGMVSFSLRLQPVIAAYLIAFLTTWVMRSRPRPRSRRAVADRGSAVRGCCGGFGPGRPADC